MRRLWKRPLNKHMKTDRHARNLTYGASLGLYLVAHGRLHLDSSGCIEIV